ncbi:MAG: STAS domain-containing protein [Anaerolineae bacterium]
MEIVVKEVQARVPVTIMQLHGELDASNYLDVIARAKEICAAGTRHLLLDLSGLSFMASSGLVALHSIALITRGDEPPDPEYGWSAYRAARKDAGGGFAENCKILNPQPAVNRTLETTGFKNFLEVYTDLETALASF